MRLIRLSARTTPATAANALPQPSAARVRLAITESEAAKIGILNRWQAAMDRRRKRAQRKVQAATLLSLSVSRLLQHAQAEAWSQRKLALEVGIPERTFRRIRDQQVNALVWLPKLQTALDRLNPS